MFLQTTHYPNSVNFRNLIVGKNTVWCRENKSLDLCKTQDLALAMFAAKVYLQLCNSFYVFVYVGFAIEENMYTIEGLDRTYMILMCSKVTPKLSTWNNWTRAVSGVDGRDGTNKLKQS